MATNPKAMRPGDPLWVAIAAVLTDHPLWTDVRVGLDVGCCRRLVARVRASLPPATGKRQARDGKEYTPRGEGRKAAVAVLAATPTASDCRLAEQAGVSLSTVRNAMRAAGVTPQREPRQRRTYPMAVAHPCA